MGMFFKKTSEVEELKKNIAQLECDLVIQKREQLDIIANVSHEIRTPLAAIIAIADNLVEGVTKYDSGVAEQIIDYGERLDELVTFLLDLSQLNSGTVKLVMETVDVGEWICSVVSPLQLLEPHKNISFLANVVPENLTARFDPKRLRQALTNLLTNAIKHADENTEVVVYAFEEEGKFNLGVYNQGARLEPDDIDIFRRFQTCAKDELDITNDRRSKLTGGTGLGLSIVKWVVDLHMGSCRIVPPENYGFESDGAMFLIQI
jgi:signal transduction histidine kinase